MFLHLVLNHLTRIYCSPIFNRLHASDVLQKTLPQLTVAGMLSPDAKLEVVPADEQGERVDARREELPDPDYVINLGEFETLAKTVLGEDSRAWKFYSSYADDGVSKYSIISFWNEVATKLTTHDSTQASNRRANRSRSYGSCPESMYQCKQYLLRPRTSIAHQLLCLS